MIVYRDQDFRKTFAPSVLTIGNFDGFHRGHQALVDGLIEKSKRLGLESSLLTFDPHPLQVLRPSEKMHRIFLPADVLEAVAKTELDSLIIKKFDLELSRLDARTFFEKWIVGRFNAKALFVGYDFALGAEKKGSLEILESMCREKKMDFEIFQAVQFEGAPISSRRIRALIEAGKMNEAGRLLGRPFFLKGSVVRGDSRGRKLGFPTANLLASTEIWPGVGVYITRVHWKGQQFQSVTNVGHRPTVADNLAKSVETFIFAFSSTIYDHSIQVDFLERIRDEQKFSSVDALVAQIHADVEHAKRYFNTKDVT